MKQLLKTTLLLPLALTGSMLIAQLDAHRTRRPRFETATRKRSKPNKIPTGLTVGKIVESSENKYVLVNVAGTVYQLDDQTTAKKSSGACGACKARGVRAPLAR
jgi:hypothetical protein